MSLTEPQPNDYKEKNYPTWNLVKQWAGEGKLSREQALFAAAVKPIEELYDLKADPDEVHNLATDANGKQTLDELRALVDGFVKENDVSTAYEDPLDIFRGYFGRLPEESDNSAREKG